MLFHAPLLVADHVEGFVAIRDTLADGHTLLHADSFAAATKMLQQQRPSLVVCGYDFDDGRMYDLLRHLKAQPQHAGVAFLAIRSVRAEQLLADSAYESVKIAVTALGGDGFVDLAWWRSRWGAQEAARRLKQRVDDLLARRAG